MVASRGARTGAVRFSTATEREPGCEAQPRARSRWDTSTWMWYRQEAMLLALVVVLLVSAEDVESAQTGGVSRGLEDALEPGSVVLVRMSPVAPASADLAKVASSARADAVATVTWTDGEGRHAHIRVQRANASAAAERDLDFKPSDAPAELGKTVGFAIASMLPNVVDPGSPTPPEQRSAVRESHDGGEPPMDDTRSPSWGLDLTFAAMTGIGGTAGGLGSGGGLRRDLGSALSVRVAATVTRGAVPDARATLTVVRPRGGIGAVLVRGRTVTIGARVEIGPWFYLVDRSGSSPSSGGRWLGGAEGEAEVAWTVAPRVALTFALGLDVAFGTTRVIVGEEQRASIPPVRGVGDAGMRVSF